MVRTLIVLWLLMALAPLPCLAQQPVVLFDAAHRENAGNADWVIDADTFDLNQEHFPCGRFEDESNAQRFPTPDQDTLDASAPEDTWTGAFSAFGIDLVKLGYRVESLPDGGRFSYLDGTNPQDLANYDVLVMPEPNSPLTPDETIAVRDWIAAGGGLFFIADHQTSDRDCDGTDSPHVGNDLMGVVIASGAVQDAGLFGIVFNVEEMAGLSDADYWFDDPVGDNVSTDPTDPIVFGPHGDGSGGLGLFGSTAMTLDRTANPTARGHVWKTGALQGDLLVTLATATHGMGRIACIGDSSPGDDGTGDPRDTLYDGWDLAGGGVANKELHLNTVEWLAFGDDPGPPDVTPPAVVDDLTAEPLSDSRIRLTWTAPGDDELTGRARRYDIRRSPRPITSLMEFLSAAEIPSAPPPSASGAMEQLVVDGFGADESAYFAVRTEDEVPNTSGVSNTAGATTGPPGSGVGPGADHLVISEIQVRGDTDHDDEFIEIHDPTSSAVDVTGWSVQYKSASGATYLVTPLPSVQVPAGGYLLLARPEYTGATAEDAVYTEFLMGAGGGHVFLVDRATPLLSCSDAGIVDAVGYGSGDCPEGSAAPTHVAGASLERLPGEMDPLCGNGTDTDDNSQDVVVRLVPDPQNLASSEGPCGTGADLGTVGPSLHVTGTGHLQWAAALGAVDYKIRRSTRRDFITARPPTDDADTWTRIAATETDDTDSPGVDALFYYWVNATDGDTLESAD